MQGDLNSEFRIPPAHLSLPPGRANSEFYPQPRVLLAAEGSGGHLIPALEVTQALAASHAQVCLLYAKRTQTAPLIQALLQRVSTGGHVRVESLAVTGGAGGWGRRLWRLRSSWREARKQLDAFRPHVVVGFGGWVSIPIVLAARQRRLPVLIHEQNVRLGRANRLLQHVADCVALSFEASRAGLNGTPALITGLPIRQAIGTLSRDEAARQFGCDPHALTVLVLGGSQGAQALNRLVCQMLGELTQQERMSWQWLHLTGASEHAAVQQVYANAGLHATILPHLVDMAHAYAIADVVIARAGASTIAELAQCGKPAVLIPYPYAGGHQRINAQLVESVGGAVWFEEATATPPRLVSVLRQLLGDERLRRVMGAQMQTLAHPNAAMHLASSILNLAQTHA